MCREDRGGGRSPPDDVIGGAAASLGVAVDESVGLGHGL